MSRIFLTLILLSLSGCAQMGYYYQAARGQAELLNRRQPVEDLLASESTDQELKQKLELAQRLRRFGVQRLGLDNNKTFTRYADLERPHVVWNVVAAPRYSIAPRTWCFPIAGCVAYKGFFDEQAARDAAQALAASGDDIVVYGVNAYSTLGWFDDPLLNTFIHYREINLAALIFHELAHQVIYFKDDSAFNEAFATAVEHLLVKDWLLANHSPAALRELRQQRRTHRHITDMVLDYRQKLASLYSQEIPEPDKARGKTRIFAEMTDQYRQFQSSGQGNRFYDWWFDQPLNNASMLTISTYYQLVPAISALIERYNEDLPAFFAAVRQQGPSILDSIE